MQHNIHTMSREELIAYVETTLEVDPAFQCMNRIGAERRYTSVNTDQALIFIDIANMHALNHKYTMSGADERIRNVVSSVRQTDTIWRYGGDELICLVPAANVEGFLKRIEQLMSDNDLYAVYGIVFCDRMTIMESAIARADLAVMQVKATLDANGMKPDRNAP